MTEPDDDSLRAQLNEWIGKPLSAGGPAVAPDEVNLPMIRHWVDALDDRNPVYLDDAAARAVGFDGIVCPPTMMQAWTMARPQIEGIAERGGAAAAIDANSPLGILATAGYTGTVATNSELEFVRHLHLGDRIQGEATLESVSERKTTGLGVGYFVTWVNTYTDDAGEIVGRQLFRIYKFEPGSSGRRPAGGSAKPKPADAAPVERGEELPRFDLDVTATVVVSGAIASRDFMPVHHDRGYANAQGAPDIFMNILTTNGYVSRYVTDWAGPQAVLRSIAVRLGAPAVPGYVLRFTGHVAKETEQDGQRLVEVAMRAANDLGDHATGTVVLTLP